MNDKTDKTEPENRPFEVKLTLPHPLDPSQSLVMVVGGLMKKPVSSDPGVQELQTTMWLFEPQQLHGLMEECSERLVRVYGENLLNIYSELGGDSPAAPAPAETIH